MNKILYFIVFIFLFGCTSETPQDSTETVKLNLEQYIPKTEFDQCLDIKTFQLLAAAKAHLEDFIQQNLISDGEDLAVGYKRFCMAWTGQMNTQMDTKSLLADDFANTFYNHPSYKDIWVRLTELGDTTYTEELAYDDEGNGVIVKFIENYWTLNTNGSYYKCLNESTNLTVKSYVINKEYGNVEPQDFALELHSSLSYEQFNQDLIQTIIVTDLYLRLIAVRRSK